MPSKAEKIEESEINRFAELRHLGPERLSACLKKQIKDMPILDQVASLAETGQLHIFYEAIGKARLQGYSWRSIAAATTGESDTKAGQFQNLNYLSYCKNNNIEPVKIRKN